jgi:chromosome segregation ATPase
MRRTLSIIALAALVPAAHATYKCVDENGRTHIGDTPPPGCATVPMFEVGPGGRVLRRIEPTPTPEQLKALAEKARRQAEADKVAAVQKRKDEALLSTFASEREFDTARDRNIEPLNARIRSAQDRTQAVDQRLAKIDEEMEFYKAGKRKATAKQEVPATLLAEQERLNQEKKTLAAGIAGYEREIVAQREKFEADKKRWIELKASAGKLDSKAAAK